MKLTSGFSRAVIVLAAAASGAIAQMGPMAQFSLIPSGGLFTQHPAIGSWFGKAVQLCKTTSDPSCFKVALLMTPTVSSDGVFLGNDSLALGGPPFGPHTTAHGRWIATSSTGIIADYVFMLPGSTAASVSALRFRWNASVTTYDTMVGYVNIFFGPEIPVLWQDIKPQENPALPAEIVPPLTAPILFYTDPAQCPSGPPACPLIFKFTIKRVSQ